MTLSNGAAVTGTIVVTLAPDKTPITVDNFLAYVNSGFYNGTVIHRVSPGFVIQGGGYAAPIDTTTPTPKTANAAIALEVGKGLSNTQWTIAMARSSDPASATSQFYVNLVDNSSSLDP
ncbi:MAG: peptidylprolyl isomerase, partial [Rhizobiales bacterium]|nr:peptidylprolyl isomerase [Rhizobacter sp.]